ncbi:MAG TPA: tetratricopeptide repeat protein [Flavobacterium sp.]|nr:tetratricopeptide repeat protein [Flavobacterium sp.]
MGKQYLIVISLVLFFGCSKNKTTDIQSQNETDKYLSLAENNKLPYKERSNYNKRALAILIEEKSSILNDNKLLKAARNFYKINELEQLYKVAKIIQDKATKNKDSLSLAKTHTYLGRYYSDKSIFDSSYIHFFKAKEILLKQKDTSILLDLYMAIAHLQFDTCDYINCEKSIFEALKYVKKDDDVNKYLIFNLLGITYCEINEYDKSLEYHYKALKVVYRNKKIPLESQYVANTLNNIGNVYQFNQDYEKSLYFYNQAFKSKNLFSDSPYLYAILKDNIAYSTFREGSLEHLPDLFYEALKIRTDLKIIKGIIVTKIHLSEYYLFQKEISKAIEFAENARDLSKKNKLPGELLESLKQLIQVDPKNAAQYSQQYIKISDSLQLAERKIRNKFARIAYETEEITLEKDDAVKQKWIFMWSAIGLILLGLSGFIIKLQKTKQKELMFVQEQQKSNEAIYQLIHDRQIKLDEGRQIEKKRIAQELHDGVMNRLASTRLNLFILNKKKDDETIEKCLGFINDIQSIEKEIRQVAHDLNNDIFSGNNSFNSILETLFNQQKSISTANIFIETDKSINWETTSSIIKINLYRILQESLQNANKYAQAKNIYVTMTKEDDLLHVVIHDDGIGFNARKIKNGIGIKNMYDRVKILSGKIDIRSAKGTLINISFPLSSQSNNATESR